jgi:hypothetical protein
MADWILPWMLGDSDNAVADGVISIQLLKKDHGCRIISLSKEGCRSVTRSVRLIYNQPSVEITNIVDKLPQVDKTVSTLVG